MEKLLELAGTVKQEFIGLIKKDIQEWMEEHDMQFESIEFQMEVPCRENGEFYHRIEDLKITMNGQVKNKDYRPEDDMEWFQWNKTFEKLVDYIDEKSEEYEEQSNLLDLFFFLNNETITF